MRFFKAIKSIQIVLELRKYAFRFHVIRIHHSRVDVYFYLELGYQAAFSRLGGHYLFFWIAAMRFNVLTNSQIGIGFMRYFA